jgi:hypothetical protein
MRRFAIVACALLAFAGMLRGGDLQLLIAAHDSEFSSTKPTSLDVYLLNEWAIPVKTLPLRMLSTTWAVIDPSGKRLPTGGGTAAISDHGVAEVVIAPGRFQRRRVRINFNAKRGDIVTVEIQLGERNGALKSNELMLRCR